MAYNYLSMNKFTFNGDTYYVSFVSRYQGIADFEITHRIAERMRFSMPGNYPRGSIQRTAYAAYRRAMHREMFNWGRNAGFPTVGHALRFINR